MWGTALQLASELGHNQVVRLLLDRGAGSDAQELDSALRAARRQGHDEIVQLLLDKGAKSEAEFEREDGVMDNEGVTSTGSAGTE